MKLIVPDYYSGFRCLAGKCLHSCCVGWEIDIDEETCERYRAVGGYFGKRLAESIDWGEEPCFRLGQDERCPFLNGDNLCDIIINLGEDALCGICADHPRFRNYFSDRTEMGIGLSCEAAAKLIVNNPDVVTLVSDDGEECLSENESRFIAMRDELLRIVQDRSKAYCHRAAALARQMNLPVYTRPTAVWARIYASLERLDERWGELLEKLYSAGQGDDLPDVVREQLLVYFIFRHLADGLNDGLFRERLGFCLLSVEMINRLCAASKESAEEIARMYSSEIEYSDENIGILLDVLSREDG